jgi:hypothetical protein
MTVMTIKETTGPILPVVHLLVVRLLLVPKRHHLRIVSFARLIHQLIPTIITPLILIAHLLIKRYHTPRTPLLSLYTLQHLHKKHLHRRLQIPWS